MLDSADAVSRSGRTEGCLDSLGSNRQWSLFLKCHEPHEFYNEEALHDSGGRFRANGCL